MRCTATLMPLSARRLEARELNAERLHGDDTTVPGLAKGKIDTGRIWVFVRDDNPAMPARISTATPALQRCSTKPITCRPGNDHRLVATPTTPKPSDCRVARNQTLFGLSI